jgi:hypothetical protein
MSRLAIITILGPGGGDVDNTLPGGPVYPGQGLPSNPGVWPNPPVYPGQGLPPFPGRPDQGLPGLPPYAVQLPVFPFDPTLPDNTLPGGEQPTPPIAIAPGARFIVKWLACAGLILVPDNSLPGGPEPK